MIAQPLHTNVLSAVGQLCTSTVAQFELALAKQIELDREQAARVEEEKMMQAELAKQAAEREEREKLEKMREREREKQEIEAVERELLTKKKALREAEKEDDDNDNASQSTADDHMVSSRTRSSYKDHLDNKNSVRKSPRKKQSEI